MFALASPLYIIPTKTKDKSNLFLNENVTSLDSQLFQRNKQKPHKHTAHTRIHTCMRVCKVILSTID